MGQMQPGSHDQLILEKIKTLTEKRAYATVEIIIVDGFIETIEISEKFKLRSKRKASAETA